LLRSRDCAHDGWVRLAAFPSASATLVPAAARMLQAAHKEITISLIEAELVVVLRRRRRARSVKLSDLAAHRRDGIATMPLVEPATRQIAAVVTGAARHPPAINAMLNALRTASTAITNSKH
jgi:DNA-binding transcriptional LysR family regulator